MNPDDLQAWNLTSFAGVATITLLIVEKLKQSPICQSRFLVNIPVYIYTLAVAIALGFLANKVITNEKGEPLIPGPTMLVLWKCVMAAASSSGLYTWLRNPEALKSANDLSSSPSKQVDSKVVVVPATTPLQEAYAKSSSSGLTLSGGLGMHDDDPTGTRGSPGGNGPSNPINPSGTQDVVKGEAGRRNDVPSQL